MHDALSPHDLVLDELCQQDESGHDVAAIAARLLADGGVVDPGALLDDLAAAPRKPGWAYVEPDTLELIEQQLEPDAGAQPPITNEFDDRITGAWLGRVAGCMLGKPVERGDHWTPEHIRDYLRLAGAEPLDDYIPAMDPMPEGYEFHPSWPATTRGNIQGGARDDDIDYTILNLGLLEQHGPGLATEDIGLAWLRQLPCLQTYTAERAAYRNLINGLRPPATAAARNPYREWIGAAIRADAFGYVLPGQPRAAAELAFRDARLSHTRNGIYAEMWIAAMVATALTGAGHRLIVEESTKHIPRRSRLAEAVNAVIADHRRGLGWDEALMAIRTRLPGYSWVHAVNNACVVAAALLWSDGDWTRAVTLAVRSGWDTDSNGATVGSIAGAAFGRRAIPPRFTEPLGDTVAPGLFGIRHLRITDLAARSATLARSFAEPATAGRFRP